MKTHLYWGKAILLPETDIDKAIIAQIADDQLNRFRMADELAPYYDGPSPLVNIGDWSVSQAPDDGTVIVKVQWSDPRSDYDEQRASQLTVGITCDPSGGHFKAVVCSGARWRGYQEFFGYMLAEDTASADDDTDGED